MKNTPSVASIIYLPLTDVLYLQKGWFYSDDKKNVPEKLVWTNLKIDIEMRFPRTCWRHCFYQKKIIHLSSFFRKLKPFLSECRNKIFKFFKIGSAVSKTQCVFYGNLWIHSPHYFQRYSTNCQTEMVQIILDYEDKIFYCWVNIAEFTEKSFFDLKF